MVEFHTNIALSFTPTLPGLLRELLDFSPGADLVKVRVASSPTGAVDEVERMPPPHQDDRLCARLSEGKLGIA